MTQSVSTRPESVEMASAAVVESDHGDCHWRVSRPHAAILESNEVDWFHLEEGSTCTRVKHNSQRDVWRVTSGGREYFAKLYHPNGPAARVKLLFRRSTASREWNVGMYAADHSIGTVIPVATVQKGSRLAGGSSLLITEAISGGMPLDEYWLSARGDYGRANALIEALARLVARAHQCGFQHRDMHPGNILVRAAGPRCEVFFVDLHAVRIGRAVSLRDVVANIAQLNQWFRRYATRSQRRRFLRYYITYRDRFAQAGAFARNLQIETAKLVADLALGADRHANRLWAKRDRRTRRTGRYFARIRPAPGWRGHVLLRSKHPSRSAVATRLSYERRQWNEWLREPLAWVDRNKHELLKDSHTATVCKAQLPTKPQPVEVIVKRPLARNPWKRLGHAFGPSRNLRAWKTANMLLNRNLPVAQPLAVIERYLGGLIRVDSLSLTDYVSPSVDLETFLTRDTAALDPTTQHRVKRCLIECLIRIIKRFHDRGFAHRDFKAPNLLVSWPPPFDGEPTLTFIDMDGIKHVRRTTEKQRFRAIARLCASLLGSPACTRTDRLRFLKRYLTGPGRTPRDWRNRWLQFDTLVCKKLRDKDARRRWKLDHYGRE